MKVALITTIHGNNLGVGISRYTDVLFQGLKKENKDSVCISFASERPKTKIQKIRDKYFNLEVLKDFYKAIKNKIEIYHFICPELMYYPEAVAIMFFIKKILGKKIVLTIHDLMTLEESEGHKLANRIINPLILKLIEYSDILIANSEQTKKEFINKLKISSDKIITTDLGVETKFKVLPRKNNKDFVVGYFGAFDKIKDPAYAVRCFSLLEKENKDYKMEMWGSGAEMEDCLKIIKENNLKNVKINGFAHENKIVETYNSFDVLLFPSKYEGFGFNILEAVSCGVPVIIRKDSRITPELKELCVIAKDEREVADKIVKLKNDKKYKENIIKHGLKKAKLFSWDKNLKQTIKIYKNLLKK
jgi:glycosyltransferase involved in cell wall biosynthesis